MERAGGMIEKSLVWMPGPSIYSRFVTLSKMDVVYDDVVSHVKQVSREN